MVQCLVDCPEKIPEDHAPSNWDTKRLLERSLAVRFPVASDLAEQSCWKFRENHASVRMGHSVHRCHEHKRRPGNHEEICPTASFCIQWPIVRLRQNI